VIIAQITAIKIPLNEIAKGNPISCPRLAKIGLMTLKVTAIPPTPAITPNIIAIMPTTKPSK